MTVTHQHFRGAIVDAAAEQIGKHHHFFAVGLRDQIFEGLFKLLRGDNIAIVGANLCHAVFVANQQR